MKPYMLAKKVIDSYIFGDKSRWIRRNGAGNSSHSLFRRCFYLESLPQKAVLLAMSANFADIYINGQLAVSLTERSYIFDKSYEVYDVLPYLVKGENCIAAAVIDTGEAVRAGFAAELCLDGADIIVTDDSWLCHDDLSVNAANYYIIASAEEKVDGRNVIPFAELDYDDSAWEKADVIGNELLHAPYDSFHQSTVKEQTADILYPDHFAAVLLAKDPKGYPVRMKPSNGGVTLAMSYLTVEEDASVCFLTHGGIRGISIDGAYVKENESFALTKGTHFLILAYSGAPEFFIESNRTLVLSSPKGGELPFATLLLPVPPVRYPWNTYRGRTEFDDKLEDILAYSAFDRFTEEECGSMNETDYDMPDSVSHAIRTRRLYMPKDGMAEKRILDHTAILPSDVDSGFANREALLSESGSAVIMPKEEVTAFILDFGVERVGRLELFLDAPAGAILEIHAFEIISNVGINYMGPAQTVRYICREGEQTFLSHRRRGFRYLLVSVLGNSKAVTLHHVRVLETRYPAKGTGFSCSDETLNQIYNISARTAEVCMLDYYVDCPGFEQNPWTGDARVTANINLYNFGAYEFDAQYLRLIAESVTEGVHKVYRRGNPRYAAGYYLPCACFPTFPEGCIPIWSFMWLLQVVDHYECTGDRKLVSDVFYAVKETLARCEKMTNDRGLFAMKGAWNLIEWANNDLSFFGEVTANNAMLSYCFKKAAILAELMGEKDLAAHYLEKSAHYCDALNRYCFSEKKNAYIDTVRDEYAYTEYCAYMQERGMEVMSFEKFASQERVSVQTNTMALLYDCVPDSRKKAAERFLLDNLGSGHYVVGTPSKRTFGEPSEEEAPNGYVHIGSPFFLFFALKALYKLGYDDLAMTAQKRDFGNFLSLGFTTCLESFPGGDDITRSVAHAWSASPAFFFVTEVLGVKPLKAGFTEFTVCPKPTHLDYAKGDVPTPYGMIHVEWKKDDRGELQVLCTAPEKCRRK